MSKSKKFKQTRPVVEQLSAKKRAAIVGADIEAAIEDGRFEFVQGYLRRIKLPGEEACKFGGCAIAALAFCVAGVTPIPGRSNVIGDECRDAAVDTGLITKREAYDLENAYECDEDEHKSPFAKLGRRLRKLAETRGGRFSPNSTDLSVPEPFSNVARFA